MANRAESLPGYFDHQIGNGESSVADMKGKNGSKSDISSSPTLSVEVAQGCLIPNYRVKWIHSTELADIVQSSRVTHAA
jgi:hypothetical protein